MRIVFIGAGNVATNLAINFQQKDLNIHQVYSRSKETAISLADKVNAEATNNIKDIITDADLYIFSVKDSAIEGVLDQMPRTSGIWVHTAGSLSVDIFSKYTDKYGVIYPFQTFTKSRIVNFADIPLFLEASSPKVYKTIELIALKLSLNVFHLNSDKRQYLHLTGVFACNFVNHLFTISKNILDKESIDFDLVKPLINETVSKIQEMDPADAQTGPAVRFDENIMNKHLSLLTDETYKNIYEVMSKSIYESNKNIK